MMDPVLWPIVGIIFTLLTSASVVSAILVAHQRKKLGYVGEVVKNLVQRIRAWWLMVAVLIVMTLLGQSALIVLYAALSFFALRELTTLTTTGVRSKTALKFSFFVLLPLQYFFVSIGWYSMFLVFIPVFSFIVIPVLLAMTSAPKGFLERTAKLQWSVLISLYFLSFVPMLQHLPVVDGPKGSPRLLVFLVFISQISDVAQYISGKMFGKHFLAPHISPHKTIEGLVLGGGVTILLGGFLHSLTPFGFLGGVLAAFLVVASGACGGLVFSAVKRSVGAKDWSASIEGHGGIMDRLDSVVFGAPLLFFAVVYYGDVQVLNNHPLWLDAVLLHL